MSDPPSQDGRTENDAGQTAAPTELRRTFWAIVGLVNIAVLGLTVGGLLIVLPAWTTAGIGAVTIGVGAGGLAYYRYRQFKAGS